MVLHWDGKLMFDQVEHEMKDRIALVVTDCGVEKFLGVPKLKDNASTGANLANAMFDVLDDRSLDTEVKAFCCDTTPSNMGRLSGAAIL